MTPKIDKKSSIQKTKATRPTKTTASIKTSRKTPIVTKSKKKIQIKTARVAKKIARTLSKAKHLKKLEILLPDDFLPEIKERKKTKS
jgi:hypothetical protein